MIRNIETIKEHSLKYIKEFMNECTIEEKIDTHYITIEIQSQHDFKIYKSNGNEVDRVDLILNSMWNNLFLDWNYLKLSNAEWFAHHVGYSIKVFYFPCERPILTQYKPKLRYVFDKAMFNDSEMDVRSVIDEIHFPDVYKVGYKHQMIKVIDVDRVYDRYVQLYEKEGVCLTDIFHELIDRECYDVFSDGEPEGFIFKSKKRIYQSYMEPLEMRKVEQEKTQYEFFLSDFIKYIKTTDYTDKITQMYTKTVCNLFNDFIINFERKNKVLEKNVEADSLENPYLGAKFDIGYEYIPDQVTKTLCRESELYKNVFKILMANLRRGKDYTHCIFLSKKEVDDWNTLAKNIKIHTIYL